MRMRCARSSRPPDPPPYKSVPELELPVIGQARLYGRKFP